MRFERTLFQRPVLQLNKDRVGLGTRATAMQSSLLGDRTVYMKTLQVKSNSVLGMPVGFGTCGALRCAYTYIATRLYIHM